MIFPVAVEAKKEVTSLEVSKTVAAVCREVNGTITVTNTGEHTGIITEIQDAIEYKLPKENFFRELRRITVLGETTEIPPDAELTREYRYELSDEELESLKQAVATRNVAYVTLQNHPRGEKTYLYRISFSLDPCTTPPPTPTPTPTPTTPTPTIPTPSPPPRTAPQGGVIFTVNKPVLIFNLTVQMLPFIVAAVLVTSIAELALRKHMPQPDTRSSLLKRKKEIE